VRVLDGDGIHRAITRLSQEILARNPSLDGLALVGIRTRGVPLAEQLADALQQRAGRRPPIGMLDINLYRDDLSLISDHPVLKRTEIPFTLDGARVVLVDDVLFTGRTVRAALEGLIDLGRPASIQLAVLIDRGHRELPICADFVGEQLQTDREDQVQVRLAATDGADEVVLLKAPRPGSTPARRPRSKTR
jgi:pyrimidine operon attenuation protein/uracil phosphoribosyltransferase